ncbi:hypothetical protein ABPG77_005541 [Micractinium sp. CCAP 211/92]
MGKVLDEPKYAVVDPAPSASKIVSNFNANDWMIFGGMTAASFPLGYLAGAQRSPAFAKVSGAMGRPSMWMGATLGALAGFMLAYQNSSGRLMGLRPNEDEVRQYGRL